MEQVHLAHSLQLALQQLRCLRLDLLVQFQVLGQDLELELVWLLRIDLLLLALLSCVFRQLWHVRLPVNDVGSFAQVDNQLL